MSTHSFKAARMTYPDSELSKTQAFVLPLFQLKKKKSAHLSQGQCFQMSLSDQTHNGVGHS